MPLIELSKLSNHGLWRKMRFLVFSISGSSSLKRWYKRTIQIFILKRPAPWNWWPSSFIKLCINLSKNLINHLSISHMLQITSLYKPSLIVFQSYRFFIARYFRNWMTEIISFTNHRPFFTAFFISNYKTILNKSEKNWW